MGHGKTHQHDLWDLQRLMAAQHLDKPEVARDRSLRGKARIKARKAAQRAEKGTVLRK